MKTLVQNDYICGVHKFLLRVQLLRASEIKLVGLIQEPIVKLICTGGSLNKTASAYRSFPLTIGVRNRQKTRFALAVHLKTVTAYALF